MDSIAQLELGHDTLGSLFGPDLPCRMVGANGDERTVTIPAAIAHSLWALPDLCGVEIFSLTIYHGHWIDDWGQSV